MNKALTRATRMVGKKLLGIELKSFVVGFATCVLVTFLLPSSLERNTSRRREHRPRDRALTAQDASHPVIPSLSPVGPYQNTDMSSRDTIVHHRASVTTIINSTFTATPGNGVTTLSTSTLPSPSLIDTKNSSNTLRVQSVKISQTEEMHPNETTMSQPHIVNERISGPRILCWIMTTYNNLMTKAVHVHDTWGQRCDKVLYFISNGTDSSSPNVNKKPKDKVNTGNGRKKPPRPNKANKQNDYASSKRTLPIVILDEIPEGRMHLLAKSNHAFDYIFRNHIDDFDWFMKADDDTYVVMENLRHFLSHTNPNEPVYFGHHFQNLYIKNGYNSGGSGYILSRDALRRFGQHHVRSRNCKADGEDEDVEIGRCLEYLGVKVGNTGDENNAVRFICFTLEQRLMGKLPKWNKDVEAYTSKMGIDSISSDAISFHYIEPWMMHALDYFVYKFKLRPEEV